MSVAQIDRVSSYIEVEDWEIPDSKPQHRNVRRKRTRHKHRSQRSGCAQLVNRAKRLMRDFRATKKGSLKTKLEGAYRQLARRNRNKTCEGVEDVLAEMRDLLLEAVS